MNGTTPRLIIARIVSISFARTPECPLASVFARSVIPARTTSSGWGSPTPAEWL